MTTFGLSPIQAGKIGATLVMMAAAGYKVTVALTHFEEKGKVWGTEIAGISNAAGEMVSLQVRQNSPHKVCLMPHEGCSEAFRDEVLTSFDEITEMKLFSVFKEME